MTSKTYIDQPAYLHSSQSIARLETVCTPLNHPPLSSRQEFR